MNWSSIFKFSILHFVALTLLSTFVTLLIGSDNLDKQSGQEFLVYFKLPSFIAGSIILGLFAKSQKTKTLLHLLITSAISSIIAIVIVSLLMGELFISPTWFIDLPLDLISILVAIFIGYYFRGIPKNAT